MILDSLFPALSRQALSFEEFPPPPGDDFWYGGTGGISTSGVRVTRETAMAISAVFACVRLLSTAVSTIPKKVYERLGENDSRLAPDHPNYRLLHRRPNAWQVASQYYELMMVHLLLRGNFFADIVMRGPAEIEQLVPLHPDRMKIEQLGTGRLRFHYTPPMGEPRVYTQDEIHYVPGLSLDGITGVSLLTFARNAIGLAGAQESHGAALFKNGSIPPYFLSAPNKMKKEAKEEFRKNWRGMHAGPENAHSPPLFDDGMKAEALGITNEDSQWLQSREFQAVEIARFFGVQPHKIAVLKDATFSNIEHQAIEFVQDSLMPWLTRIEQCEERDLFDPEEPFYPEFLVDSRLRGDTKSRYAAYSIGIKGRFLTPNEARAKENLNPIEGGDEFPESPGVTGKGSPEGRQDQPEGAGEEGGRGAGDAGEESARGAFGLLLEDAAARIAAAEVRGLEARADKADEDRAQWNGWAREVYDRHREYLVKTLAPIGVAWFRATARQVDLETLARRWCRSCLDEITEAPDVPATLAEWRNELALSLTARLKGEFFNVLTIDLGREEAQKTQGKRKE